MKANESQIERIFQHLKKGKKITPLQALQWFGTMRLAAYIHELKKRGHDVKTAIITVGPQKKRVAQYSMVK